MMGNFVSTDLIFLTVLKIIFAAGILIIFVVLFVMLAIFIKGYLMYKTALKRNPMQNVIDSIRNRDSFVPIRDISVEFRYILLIAEDGIFFKHKGYDLMSIYGAFRCNLKNKRIVRGGSTISQQLVKNMFFCFDKIYSRKVAEIFAVRKLEKLLSKEEILELYCNRIEFGENVYGIKEACDYYFKILPSEITVKKALELCAIIVNPKKYLLLERNELFKTNLAKIEKNFITSIQLQDRSYFQEHHDVLDEKREFYKEIYFKNYLEKMKNREALEALFE